MAKTNGGNLDLGQTILSRLAEIQHKVDSLEQTHAFALRADQDRHHESIKAIFKKSDRRAQVYLAVDGRRSVGAIADHLGMQQSHVSRALAELKDEGLLKVIGADGALTIYGRNPIDRTLRISKYLMEEYHLLADGRKDPQSKGKKAGKRKQVPNGAGSGR